MTKDADYTGVKLYYNLCDVTEMFGAGNEPATVEAFKALFPKDYYPYNAGTETLVGTVNGMDTRSISISLGSTVYSGWVDVISGVGNNDKRMLALNSEMEIVTYDFQGKHGVAFVNVLPEQMTRAPGMCSHSGQVGNYFDANAIWLGVNSQYVYWIGILDILGLTTVSEFKAWLDTQTVQLLFLITNHDEITVTPQEVQSLLGDNVVWSDANGNLTVEYRSN